MANDFKALNLLELISSLISAVFFSISTLLGWFMPYSSYFFFISGFILIMGVICLKMSCMDSHKRNNKLIHIEKAVIYSSSIICFLSFIALEFYRNTVVMDEDNRLLCDFTEHAINIDNHVVDWYSTEEIENNNIRFYSTSLQNTVSDVDLVKSIVDVTLLDNGESINSVNISSDKEIGGDLKLTVIKTWKVKKTLNENVIRPLPYSVNISVCGYKSFLRADWNKARELFTRGVREGNGVSAYYLYTMFKDGCGMDSNPDSAFFYLKKACSLGYRKAQYEYGRKLLYSEKPADILKGKQLLLNASLLTNYRSVYSMRVVEPSIRTLQDFFEKTGQYKEAYRFTKSLVKHNQIEYQLYERHLDNCLLTNHIDEAYTIIEKGKSRIGHINRQDVAYCYVRESQILSKGLGRYPVNLSKAEMLLRFASDSLDSKYARDILSELYLQQGYEEEASIWHTLYAIDFHNNIAEN